MHTNSFSNFMCGKMVIPGNTNIYVFLASIISITEKALAILKLFKFLFT